MRHKLSHLRNGHRFDCVGPEPRDVWRQLDRITALKDMRAPYAKICHSTRRTSCGGSKDFPPFSTTRLRSDRNAFSTWADMAVATKLDQTITSTFWHEALQFAPQSVSVVQTRSKQPPDRNMSRTRTRAWHKPSSKSVRFTAAAACSRSPTTTPTPPPPQSLPTSRHGLTTPDDPPQPTNLIKNQQNTARPHHHVFFPSLTTHRTGHLPGRQPRTAKDKKHNHGERATGTAGLNRQHRYPLFQ